MVHPWKLMRLAIEARGFAAGLRLRAESSGAAVSPNGRRPRGRLLLRNAGVLAVAFGVLSLSLANGAEKPGSIEEAARKWSNRGKPVAEALRLLARVNAELRESPREELFAQRAVLFEGACRRANAKELRALAEMIPDLAVDAPEAADAGPRFKECIGFYGTAVLQHEVTKLQARPAKLKMKPSKAAPPPELAVAPKELRDAWLAWRGAIEPFERLKEEARNAPAEANEMQGGRHAIALLKKLGPRPAPGLWRQIIAEEERALQTAARDGGDTWLHTRRALHCGILLSLVADGRMEEAVGAVCSQILKEEGYPSDPSRKTYAARAREFLAAQGLDWELLYAGLLLAERPVKPGDFRANALANTEAWLLLGALGSARGVQRGIDWINHANMGSEEARPFLLRALGPAPEPPKLQMDPRPQRQKALPAEVRAKAAAALGKLLDPAQLLAALHRTLEDVPPWLAKDLEEPLQKLATHPSQLIATRARWLLMNAGLVPRETNTARAIPPIRIRLKVDGESVAGMQVVVRAEGIQQRPIATNADGELIIPLDGVLDPAKINSVLLATLPKQWTGVKPNAGNGEDAPIPARTDEHAKDTPAVAREDLPMPWFSISVPVKAGDERAQEVAIETGELEVGLKGCAGVPDTAQVIVTLVRDARNGMSLFQGTGKPGESIVFDRVQAGTYQMRVDGPQLALRPWQAVHVTKMGSLKLVELSPGRSARATLAGAARPNLRLPSIAQLTRDGQDVKGHNSTRADGWDRLPLGKYRLRILSTTALEAAMKARGINRQVVPKPQRHAGYEMEFELTEDSPAVVDLGVITLEPEEQ